MVHIEQSCLSYMDTTHTSKAISLLMIVHRKDERLRYPQLHYDSSCAVILSLMTYRKQTLSTAISHILNYLILCIVHHFLITIVYKCMNGVVQMLLKLKMLRKGWTKLKEYMQQN